MAPSVGIDDKFCEVQYWKCSFGCRGHFFTPKRKIQTKNPIQTLVWFLSSPILLLQVSHIF